MPYLSVRLSKFFVREAGTVVSLPASVAEAVVLRRVFA